MQKRRKGKPKLRFSHSHGSNGDRVRGNVMHKLFDKEK